ncbi:MAG: hypothetical protein Q9M91_03535 [Candidatus Dojkabacteria bacterium]|nr:hypothetical protein [Candidatus Dojkabacteria bacterium]MDQ7020894.1 hypothetical protein [Candidatus Dojkabacteria bacterium]
MDTDNTKENNVDNQTPKVESLVEVVSEANKVEGGVSPTAKAFDISQKGNSNNNTFIELAKKTLSLIYTFLKAVFEIVFTSLKTLVKVFFSLDLRSKLTFIITLVIVAFAFLYIGIRMGEGNIKNEVETATGKAYSKIIK